LKASLKDAKDFEDYLRKRGKANDPDTPAPSQGEYRDANALLADKGQDIGKAEELKKRDKNPNFFSPIIDQVTKGDFFYEFNLSRNVFSRIDTAETQGKEIQKKIAKARAEIRKAGGDVSSIDPGIYDQISDGLIKEQSRLKTLQQNAESISERNAYEKQLKDLEPLIKLFEKSTLPTLNITKAFAELDRVNKRADSRIAQRESDTSDLRGAGAINDYQAQKRSLNTTIEERQKQAESAKVAFEKLRDYLATPEYKRRVDNGEVNATEDENKLLDAEKAYYSKRKELGDDLTKVRELQYNRRAELLQREVAQQERLTSRREGQRKLTTTERDAGLSLGAARLEISPQDLKLQQIQSQEDDATFAFEEGYKKRANAVKNLKQAQQDLKRINPNDEQQYESGKAAVAQYEQAVLAAGAEINSQQKAFSDAQLARIQEEQAQTSTLVDQAVRRTELGVQKRINANNNIAASQKRQFDTQVAGLERVNKLVGKQNELTQAQANLAQARGSGRLSGLKSAEDLAQQVKDLDPKKKEETPQDKEKKRDRLGGILDRIGLGRDPEKIFQKEVTAANDLAKIKAKALNAEIRGAEITLEIEQRKEKIARERAVREAESAKRSAQLGVDKASIGVKAAEIRLSLAKESGDPNKVNEAQLNLEQAKLDFESAAIELPNAANAVNEALLDLANSIRESALQKELGGVSAESKRSQFGLEERDRVTSTQVEAANKGFDFGRTRVQDQSGLVPLRGITLRNDPIYRSGVKESRFEAAEERSIARQRPESLQFNDRANNIKTFASYGLNLRPGESLGNLAKFNGLGAPSVAPPDLSKLLQTPSFSASTPTQNEQATFDPSGQIVEALNRQLQIVQAMNAKLAGLLQKELTATVQVNGTSSNDDVQIRGGR
jgi:hypothetical protein